MAAPLLVLFAGGLFVWCRRHELRNRGTAVVALIWALLLLDFALFPNSSTVPPGIFHPDLGGLSFRLFELVIPIALVARISVHGLGKFGGNGLLWVAFLAWLVTEGVIGVLNGNNFDQVTFEGKAIVYLAAIYLTATIPASQYLASRHITRLIGAAAILATVLLITDTAGVAIDLGARPPDSADVVSSAGEALDPAGAMSSDGATLFVALGMIALALAFSSPKPRQRAALLVAAGPLLASVVGAAQRAAYLELVVALVVLLLLIMVSRRTLRTTATEIGLAAMIVIAAVLLPTIVSTALAEEAKRPPLEQEITGSFSGQVEVQTTEGRLYQWQTATGLIEQRPILGWGLGKEFEYFDPGFDEFFEIHVTHNIVLDLLLGAGVIGLLIFLAAIATTGYRGLRAWLGLNDDLLAALALGTLAAIGGLLAKGIVESVFEKYRIAVALALLLGIVISVASAYELDRTGQAAS
jgi:O-antigen ligase/polysaccharide polymerase Wzy-like membrane protein